jgi:serine/threonine protein kinase
MPIAPGSKLGPYEILAAIGAGGMGEVYRAHDTRLGRDVAVKILPETFASDADRLRRFNQEARVVASLASGRRAPMRDLAPADRSGVTDVKRVSISADGKWYAYEFARDVSTLFTVEGVK